MPSYKLHYFNGKGRAEGSRMLFALAGVEYEDVRHKWEDWLKIKPDIPFHKLPYLEVDNVIVTQSRAIERYLARKFGYYGKTELEQTRTDMVIDCIEDMIHNLGEINKVDSEEKKDEIRKRYTDSIVPGYLEDFHKLITEDGHFLEGEISWADISLYGSLFIIPLYLGVNLTEVVEKYPKVKTLCHTVVSHSKIAEWIKNRPDTKF